MLFDLCVLLLQVGMAKDSSLTNQLIDYLMGESDAMPKVTRQWAVAFKQPVEYM